jgi:ABC-type transport system involved in multi-copper enzyme maturation permease subunit
MTWVSWRLQRTETMIAIAILALLAALLIPTGITMANAYHQDGLSSCLALNVGPTCAQRIGAFQSRFQALNVLANWFTLVPGLIGVLLAAPFILDLEQGTYRLAWTQSITRGRWLLGKLALPIVAAILAGGALLVLFTWWRAPQVNLNGRLDIGIYDTQGIVVVGYTLFALALALALGAVWRRSAISLTVAFVGYFAMRVFVDYWLRDRLVSPLMATWKGGPQPHFLYHAFIISENATIKGHHISTGGGLVGGHSQLAAPGLGAGSTFHAVYEPASNFWPLQLTETGLFAGLAALLILFAAWWTYERVA